MNTLDRNLPFFFLNKVTLNDEYPTAMTKDGQRTDITDHNSTTRIQAHVMMFIMTGDVCRVLRILHGA